MCSIHTTLIAGSQKTEVVRLSPKAVSLSLLLKSSLLTIGENQHQKNFNIYAAFRKKPLSYYCNQISHSGFSEITRG